MTTTTMTKEICLPQQYVEDVIFKLQQRTGFDFRDQSALQAQLEDILKTQRILTADLVVTDVPATIDHSSHDANAVTITHQDDPTRPQKQQVTKSGHEKPHSGSDEEDHTFSPSASKGSLEETSPRDLPARSTRGSLPEPANEKSSGSSKQAVDDMPIADPSDNGNNNSQPNASSQVASDTATPPLKFMSDESSPEDNSVAASQQVVLPNETLDLPATEEFLEPHPTDSGPASIHTERMLNLAPDSPVSERSFGSCAVDSRPASRVDSRPQSTVGSMEAFGDLSFKERWNFNWDSEDGGLSLGSQSMAAYASPVQNGHRVRTSCDSHKDPGNWRVYPDGFINEVSRAGGPLLTPLPYEEPRDSSTGHSVFRLLASWRFILFITEVMTKYNIHPTSMEFHKYEWCHTRELPASSCLMFAATRESVDNAWLEASREIWAYIRDHVKLEFWESVSVEIFDPVALHFPQRMWFRDFPDLPLKDLSTELLGAIDTSEIIKTMWCHLKMGPFQKVVPAFCLLVDYRSSRDWRTPREQMVAVLDKHNLSEVAIFITKRKDWGESKETRLMTLPRFG